MELANSVEERIGILEKQVAILSDLEEAATALQKAGQGDIDPPRKVNFDRDLVDAMLRKMSTAGVAHVGTNQQRTISLNQWAKIKLAAWSSARDENGKPIEVDWRIRLLAKKDGRLGMQLSRALDVATVGAPEADEPASAYNLIRFQPDEAAIMPWHFHFLEEDRRDSLIENQGGDRFLVVQLAGVQAQPRRGGVIACSEVTRQNCGVSANVCHSACRRTGGNRIVGRPA